VFEKAAEKVEGEVKVEFGEKVSDEELLFVVEEEDPEEKVPVVSKGERELDEEVEVNGEESEAEEERDGERVKGEERAEELDEDVNGVVEE